MSDHSEKFYFRQRGCNRLYEAVVTAIETASSAHGIRKKDIAERLSVNPSQITRWLSGPSNWTIDTVHDLLYSIKAEIDYNIVFFSDRVKQNEFHPANSMTYSMANSAKASGGSVPMVITMQQTSNGRQNALPSQSVLPQDFNAQARVTAVVKNKHE